MAAKKVKETPDFVKGLLTSADGISTLLNPDKMPPRLLLKKLQDDKVTLGQFTSEECQELGMYQARVVLMVLAAELALKLLWEQDKGKPASKHHGIDQLFDELCGPLQAQIHSKYCEQAQSPPGGWETPGQIFKLLKNASVQWRYLVEKSNFPNYVMQAKFLKHATLAVLQVRGTLAQGSEEPSIPEPSANLN